MAACRSKGGCRSPKRAEVSGWSGACCKKDVWPLIRAVPFLCVAALRSGVETIIMHYPRGIEGGETRSPPGGVPHVRLSVRGPKTSFFQCSHSSGNRLPTRILTRHGESLESN